MHPYGPSLHEWLYVFAAHPLALVPLGVAWLALTCLAVTVRGLLRKG